MFQSFAFLFGATGAGGVAEAEPPPIVERKPVRPKIGIALGGGAARGWSHIGVLKRFRELGFEPDIVVGTSIGAVVGGCYAAGKLDELEQFARSLSKRKVLGLLDVTLGGSGLIGGRKLQGLLDRDLAHHRVEGLPKPFAAVATEIGTGHEIWLKRGPLVEAMRASYALPGILEPVKIGRRWLMDGALVNPIPISVCRALGASIVIGVNLHGDTLARGITVTGQEPEETSIEDDVARKVAEVRESEGERLLKRKFVGVAEGAPGLSTVMAEAFTITQDRIARSRLAGDPPDVMISPRLGKVGLFEFHKADDSIAAGEEAAERAFADLKATVEQLT